MTKCAGFTSIRSATRRQPCHATARPVRSWKGRWTGACTRCKVRCLKTVGCRMERFSRHTAVRPNNGRRSGERRERLCWRSLQILPATHEYSIQYKYPVQIGGGTAFPEKTASTCRGKPLHELYLSYRSHLEVVVTTISTIFTIPASPNAS